MSDIIRFDITVAADDITGRNPCPLWKRINALQLATPIDEQGRNSLAVRVSRNRGSHKIWIELADTIYEFPNAVAFFNFIDYESDAPKKAWRLNNRIKEAKAKGELYLLFSYKGEGANSIEYIDLPIHFIPIAPKMGQSVVVVVS